jgi:enamine deaminase RidA (YjgF/YER057c/UK114 family)
MNRILQPEGWKRPRGYSHGVEARGRVVFVAGQVAFGPDGTMVGDDLPTQTGQALKNMVAVLACAGAAPRHVVRMTWYVVDVDEYRRALGPIGDAYRAIMGAHFPAMTLVGVAGLVEPDARVEIEATAVIPDGGE